MSKHKNFIERLRNRGASANQTESAITPQEEQIIIIIREDDNATISGVAETFDDTETLAHTETFSDDTEAFSGATEAGPTMCLNGKLYRARLRSGGWETIGPPIGNC